MTVETTDHETTRSLTAEQLWHRRTLLTLARATRNLDRGGFAADLTGRSEPSVEERDGHWDHALILTPLLVALRPEDEAHEGGWTLYLWGLWWLGVVAETSLPPTSSPLEIAGEIVEMLVADRRVIKAEHVHIGAETLRDGSVCRHRH